MNEKLKLKEIFGQIQAEEKLKISTREFIEKKTGGYTGGRMGRHHGILAAACLCFLLVIFGGRWLYFTPTTKISIDINPSIELNINRFGRVISADGYNHDGEELLNALNIKFLNYSDAIEQIFTNKRIKVLLAGDEVMTITVTGDNFSQSEEIFLRIEACTTGRKNTYCYYASTKELDQAHKVGLSYGKYRAFLELQELDPEITAEEVKGMTMREIRDLAEYLSSGDKEVPPDTKGHGHGYGHGWGGGKGKREE